MIRGFERLLAGLFWAPIGIAATVGVIAYFALAVGAHIIHDDVTKLLTPAVLLAVAVFALALRLLTM